MWFAKWFGGRKEDDSDQDEPARFAAPQIPPDVIRRPDATAEQTAARQKAPAQPGQKPGPKGFDPYNSGSFERRNAWERVSKR